MAEKALTLHQPWASLIAMGVKTIETRSWSTSYRGPLAIHAGARKPSRAERFVGDFRTRGIGSYAGGAWILEGPDLPPYRSSPRLQGYRLPLGAIVASCELVDVVPIVHGGEGGATRRVENYDGSTSPLWLSEVDEEDENGETWGEEETHEISDQLPYGDFTPGRFAWLLGSVTPVDPPIPCKGRQGLWEWTGG